MIRKLFRRTRSVLVTIALTVPLVCSADPRIAEDTALVQSTKALEAVAQKVEQHVLPNGLRVVMYRRGDAPVFAGAVVVRVGGSDETPGITGISHIFEHMAFKGTPEIGVTDYSKERPLLEELEVLAARERANGPLSKTDKARWDEIISELKSLWITDQFTREYDRRGAVGMNATTDTDNTRYFVSLPRTSFEFWAYMESERILNPVMRQFYQERDVVLEERRMRYGDDPRGKLYELLLSAVFRVHPYQNPVIGHPGDVSRLTATMLDEFRRIYYVPSNIAVAVVGDIRPAEDLKTIEKYFGRLPAAPPPPRPHLVEPPQSGERRVTLRDRAAPQFIVAYRKPNYPHPDDAPLSIMNEILAGSRVSPLYRELVQKRRLAVSIGHSEAPGSGYPNVFYFQAAPRAPHSNEEVLRAFDEVIAEFKRKGTTPEALAIAKRSIGMSYLSELKSNSSLALSFATAELLYGSWRAAFDWYNEVMKVTVDDIARVAREYLDENQRTLALLETATTEGGAK